MSESVAMTLTDWLLARIAEDEAVARVATPGPWRWEHEDWADADRADWKNGCVYGQDWDHHGPDLVDERRETVVSSFGFDADGVIVKQADAAHIARHDPAHVLAVCAAHRRIVLSMGDLLRAYEREPETGNEVRDEAMLSAANIAESTLRALASIYADRDGFREEWRL